MISGIWAGRAGMASITYNFHRITILLFPSYLLLGRTQLSGEAFLTDENVSMSSLRSPGRDIGLNLYSFGH